MITRTRITRGSFGEIFSTTPRTSSTYDYPGATLNALGTAYYAGPFEIVGEWCTISGQSSPISYQRALDILQTAISTGLIPQEYCDVDYKHRGSARNYDLYDFAPGVALVQKRETVCTKYGNSPQKTYLLLRRNGAGKITVEEMAATKARIAKLAKSGLPFGGVIAAITGKKPTLIKTAANTAHTGYKIVSIDSSGSLVSVWDGSAWPINKWRAERATDNHMGGHYYYDTESQAITAAAQNEVFGDSGREAGKKLVLIRVEVRGRVFSHETKKRCATYMRVIEKLREITINQPQETQHE